MIAFDAETAALLERAYRGRDFVRRRHANIEALDPRPGARLLDVGCGTGYMLAELAGAVGAGGHAAGVDLSDDMLAAARDHCAGAPNVSIRKAGAEDLPFEDGAFDGAVSVQVFEYMDDMSPALRECRRVLKSGGRLVIGDMHFGTLTWHSEDPDRMAAMVEAWDAHFADGAVPARILGLLPDAGFRHLDSRPVSFVDTECRPDGLARMMSILMPAFARARGSMAEDAIAAWEEEQAALARAGRFFFAMTHVITVAEAV